MIIFIKERFCILIMISHIHYDCLFQFLSTPHILYSYLVGCCPISNLFGRGEPNIGSPLPNKSDIGQAADQTTVFIIPAQNINFASKKGNYFKN